MTKIIKHKIAIVRESYLLRETFFDKKEDAIQYMQKRSQPQASFQYLGEVEIELYCENCNKELTKKDQYLTIDEHTRYCNNCYETHSITTYTSWGETIADENTARIHEPDTALN